MYCSSFYEYFYYPYKLLILNIKVTRYIKVPRQLLLKWDSYGILQCIIFILVGRRIYDSISKGYVLTSSYRYIIGANLEFIPPSID
jgi:hypothetical protein